MFAAVSESSDLDSPVESAARIATSCEHPPRAGVKTVSPSTLTVDMNDQRNEYAQAGIATYVILYKERCTEGSREGKVIVCSVEHFGWQGVKEVLRKGRENTKPGRVDRERERYLRGFCCTSVFRGSSVADCAILREKNLMV